MVDADAARFEEHRRERAAKDAAVAAKAAAARARQEADEVARRAMPCAQCGEPETGGLCGTCWGWEETEKLLTDEASPCDWTPGDWDMRFQRK
ncbi:hypothetical protein [Streptomyces sp. NPDC054765]